MGVFAVGDVVLVSFPYADFSKFKKRPALVVGYAEFDNLILCQITSKAETSRSAIRLTSSDFSSEGGLNLSSYIRPDKLFTLEQSIIEKHVGTIKATRLKAVRADIRQLFK